jgi:DNA-binding NtrC family response regulator
VPGSELPPLAPSALRVRVVRGVDEGIVCMLGSAPLTVGSAPTSGLCLSDRHVSRLHCELVVRAGQCWVRDLGSTNGTYLDGKQVVDALLSPTARVLVGSTELVLEPLSRAPGPSIAPPGTFGEMIGPSAAMQQVFHALRSVARSSLTCLLLGETGTGKELAARALHDHSDRAHKPFLVVDCAAVGAQFIEDKLFGHERGSFTGAQCAVAGVFEQGRGGTIFLDEIGELPVPLQAKLLGVLERREATRIGSHTPIKLDIRLVAATHRNPSEMAQRGQFRQDLLYRLSEFTLRIPALRERPEDIGMVAEVMLRREGNGSRLTEDAVEYLKHQLWPGNIRELRNVMRRAAVLARDAVIDRDMLQDMEETTSVIQLPSSSLHSFARPRSLAAAPVSDDVRDSELFAQPLAEATEAFRKTYVAYLRQRFGNDLNAAAAHAGVHAKSVSRLFRLYDVY